MMHRMIAVAALTVLLAACDGGTDGDATRGGAAEGEVLGGTISDEMLPLDTVRSQSPPLPSVQSEEGEGDEEAEAETTDETPDAQEPGETDDAEGAEADTPPQIQLDPAPEPATAAPEEGDGDQTANP